jgi:hypothetical protein
MWVCVAVAARRLRGFDREGGCTAAGAVAAVVQGLLVCLKWHTMCPCSCSTCEINACSVVELTSLLFMVGRLDSLVLCVVSLQCVGDLALYIRQNWQLCVCLHLLEVKKEEGVLVFCCQPNGSTVAAETGAHSMFTRLLRSACCVCCLLQRLEVVGDRRCSIMSRGCYITS